LEIEREAIKREKDERKLDSMNKQIANAREKRDACAAAWQSEKEIVDTIQNIRKEKIENSSTRPSAPSAKATSSRGQNTLRQLQTRPRGHAQAAEEKLENCTEKTA
jgi:hypothetical protein